MVTASVVTDLIIVLTDILDDFDLDKNLKIFCAGYLAKVHISVLFHSVRCDE